MSAMQTIADFFGLGSALPKTADLLSRRKTLLGAGALAALFETPAKAAPPQGNIEWLVNRTTFGATQADYALATTLGYQGYLEYQLNYTAINDSDLNARLTPSGFYSLTMNNSDLALFPQPDLLDQQLYAATILRAVYSKRQLYEKMVEFWSDHFNIFINKAYCPWIKTTDDRDVVRAHALGKFPDMLTASMNSAAMMYYLDNLLSYVGHPNENYARELMELHTLGVGGGYTQQDVQEVARCLTGYRAYAINQPGQGLEFYYYPPWHDQDPKVVLGNNIAAGGGYADGQLVHDILSTHPSTAHFISTKLCKRFWGEAPPSDLVLNVAATYLSTGGDIKEMLRTLLSSTNAATATPKFKRPFNLIISALRTTGANVVPFNSTTGASLGSIRDQLSLAGQLLFNCVTPDGYHDTFQTWSGGVLPRWNFGAALMNNELDGVTVDLSTFTSVGGTAQAVANEVDARLFNNHMNAVDKARIVTYMQPDNPPEGRIRDAIGLAIGSPGFQWY